MGQSIASLIEAVIEHGASDLFLHEGELARAKIGGELMVLGDEVVEEDEMASFWRECGAHPGSDLDRDTAWEKNDVRFRVNLHVYLGRLAAVLRQVKTEIPEMEALGVPGDLLRRWVSAPAGLVLVTGQTGSGKSTTLASALNWMNGAMARHVVTIEDPIEFIFHGKRCLFTQREVGNDTYSFAHGLKSSLRQAPDVIFVGEIRDDETATTALQASETGHLVLATLHSENVRDTLDRITNLFPPGRREGALHLLGHQLVGVICQKLLPAAQGGLYLVVEHMENAGATRGWIREGNADALADFLARGDGVTNRSFMQSLVEACRAGLVDEDTAMQTCGNEMEFRRAMRGIA